MSKHNTLKILSFEANADEETVKKLNALGVSGITYKFVDPVKSKLYTPSHSYVKRDPDFTGDELKTSQDHAFRVGAEFANAAKSYKGSSSVQLTVVMVRMPSYSYDSSGLPTESPATRILYKHGYGAGDSTINKQNNIPAEKARLNPFLNIVRNVIESENKTGAKVSGINLSFNYEQEGVDYYRAKDGTKTLYKNNKANDVMDHVNRMITDGRKEWGAITVASAGTNYPVTKNLDGTVGKLTDTTSGYDTKADIARAKKDVYSAYTVTTLEKADSIADANVLTSVSLEDNKGIVPGPRAGASLQAPNSLARYLYSYANNAIKNGTYKGSQITVAFQKAHYDYLKNNTIKSNVTRSEHYKKFDQYMEKLTINREPVKKSFFTEFANSALEVLKAKINDF